MNEKDLLRRFYRRIGKNIVFFRKKNELKQEYLGNELGISQSLISQYETAKKFPSLETIVKFSDYFKIPLKEFMFTDFSVDDILENETISYGYDLRPIVKCAKQTYFCYYIKEQNKGTYAVSSKISYFIIHILNPLSDNSAEATLIFPEKKHTYKASLSLDDRYAYLECHEYQRDYFFHLTFYYHKSRSRVAYSGGIGLMQRLDANELPVFQFCVISHKLISEQKQLELLQFLRIDEENNVQLPRRKFSSGGVLRLTKSLDQKTFDWLRTNKYI